MQQQQYPADYNNDTTLNPEEIAKAAAVFDNLKHLRIKLKTGDEAVLERAFELHVQTVLEKLSSRLKQFSEPQQQRVEVILARHGLYDAAFQQVALLCHSSKHPYIVVSIHPSMTDPTEGP